MATLNRLIALISIPLVALGGCASYTPSALVPEEEVNRLRSAEVRLVEVKGFHPGLQLPPHDLRFDLADGLDEAEVVTVALTLNPRLQARREQVGVSQAALISAGQWPNPEVGAGLRPGISGSSGYVIEADALFQLLRIGEREALQKSATARIEQANAALVAEEHALVAEVRQQRLTVLAADRTAALMQEALGLRQRSHDLVRRQREIGDVTELDLSATELDLAEAKREVRKAIAEREIAVHDLNRLLGLPLEYVLNLNGIGQPLPVTMYDDVTDAELDRRLLAGRFELRAKEAAYRQAEQELRIAVLQQFPSLGIGPSFERELEGDASLGVALSLELPLLNQNQGQIAEKRSAREQARAEYRELLHHLRADAYAARAAVRVAKAEVDAQETEVIPVLKRNQALFEKAYRARELNIIDWITAQQRAMNARKEHLNALVAYRRALIKLEAASGQPLPLPANSPSTQPN
jgi:outer membrane protein TolC